MVQPPQLPRNGAPMAQELFRVLASARDAAASESRRRLNWEREQDAKNAQAQTEMHRELLDVRQELAMLKAYIGLPSNVGSSVEMQQGLVHITRTSAHIEPVSPVVEPKPWLSPVSPMPSRSTVQQPQFVQGSSSRPHLSQYPSPAPSAVPSPSTSFIDTPQSSGSLTPPRHAHSHSPMPTSLTPSTEANPRKRSRQVLEDESDYDSDTEESDTPPTARALKRKGGRDERCLTIHVGR